MKKYILLSLLLFIFTSAKSQYNIIYSNSFRNWLPGQGWVMLNNDTIPVSAGLVTNSITAGVPTPSIEVLDYELGINQLTGSIDKIMITPPVAIGGNTYMHFFSKYSSSMLMTVYAIADPNDTTVAALTDSIALCNNYGFNAISLNAYANTTIRLAFRLKGITGKGFIDDLKIFDKYSLAYIPDSCFRTYLKTVVPAGFIGDSLDYLHNDVLRLRRIFYPNGCIKSLEGLQYFSFIQSLIVNDNQISYIPSDKIAFLDTLNVKNNLLPYLPDMPIATWLDFENNLSTKIPDFFNQYCMKLHAKNNLIYDCLPGTNRFVDGDVSQNISVNTAGYFYYTMIGGYNSALPAPNCSQALGYLNGRVYYDYNLNNIFDNNDFPMPEQPIDFYQGPDIYSHALGKYSESTDSGFINMNVTRLPSFFTCTTPLADTLQPQTTITHDFRIIKTSSVNDLEINISSGNTVRLAESVFVNIAVRNKGTEPANGTIKFAVPYGFTLLNNSAGILQNDTLTWDSILNPFTMINTWFELHADSALTDQRQPLVASVSTANDAYPANNIDTAFVFVRDSLITVPPMPWGYPYDPNNKIVSTPVVPLNYNGFLEYNINFENIGTANATRVMVRDYLPTTLDYNTFEFLGGSHPCTIALGTDSTLQFVFYPIVLTPHDTDSVHSQGHFWFRIKPKAPIVAGVTITNTAAIYFDSQPPVQTNPSYVVAEDTSKLAFYSSRTVVCDSGDVEFSDISFNSSNRQWFFQGGTPQTSTALNPVVHYNTPGIYRVKLVALNNGVLDSVIKTAYITVDAMIKPVINYSGFICRGDSLRLTQNLSSGYSYGWFNYYATPFYLPYTTSNVYVTLTDSLGCKKTSDTVHVVVSPVSPPSITGNTNLCVGASTTLSVPGPFVSYNWSTGDTTSTVTTSTAGVVSVNLVDTNGCAVTATRTLVTDSVLFSISGVPNLCGTGITELHAGVFNAYLWSDGTTNESLTVFTTGTYTVTVTDGYGCSNSHSIVVTNVAPQSVTVTGTDSICNGQQSTLTASAGFASYHWSTNDTTSSVNAGTSGLYTVTATDITGCTTVGSFQLHVNVITPVITGDNTICDGDTASFATAIAYNDYLWSTNESTPSITLSSAGTYTVTVTDSDGCTGMSSFNLTLNPLPAAILTAEDSVCAGSSAYLFTDSGFESYLWSNGDTTVGTTITTPGIYSVTITNSYGCTQMLSHEVFGAAPMNLLVQNNAGVLTADLANGIYQWMWCDSSVINGAVNQSYRPAVNGSYAVIIIQGGCMDTSACYPVIVTGVDQLSNDVINIYPNPAGDVLYIHQALQMNDKLRLSIKDALGKELNGLSIKLINDTYQVDLAGLQAGVYFVQITSGGIDRTYRFIKE